MLNYLDLVPDLCAKDLPSKIKLKEKNVYKRLKKKINEMKERRRVKKPTQIYEVQMEENKDH